MKRFKNIYKLVFIVLISVLSFIIIGVNSGGMQTSVVAEQTENKGKAFYQLNHNQQTMYNFLSNNIKKVISGETQSTSFIINSQTLSDWEVKTQWFNTDFDVSEINFEDVKQAFLDQFNIDLVTNALLHDLPYELFWFDKGQLFIEVGGSGNTNKITITSLVLKFSVTTDYKPSVYDEQNPNVDSSKMSKAVASLNNAKAIVEECSALNDYQKVVAYKNRICELTSYNDYAASGSYAGGYGNPWQLINVFDNDPLTEAVCEGYSKAFQLLCDLSTFNDNICCYTVTGKMNGGDHMWNVVIMDDGLSYIVDITNSDTGSVGQSGGLFLNGNQNGSITSGYIFSLGSNVTYVYNDETKQLWGTTEESILKLANSNYHVNHPVIDITQDENLIYDGLSITVGNSSSGADVIYGFIGDNETAYNWTYEYHLDNMGVIGSKIEHAPVNAGDYWVKVIATNKIDNTYVIVHSEKITIKQKELDVESVTAQGKKFDGTADVVVTKVNLKGVINNDSVNVNLQSVHGSVSAIDIGVYNYINLSNLSLYGENSKNYKLQTLINNVESNSIEIIQAEPSCVADCTKVSGTGKVLSELVLNVIAKGANNVSISGVFIWVNEAGDEIDVNTEIVQGEKYWFKFIPNDPNYMSSLGYVIPWNTESATNKTEVTITDIASYIEYALYALAAIAVITCVVLSVNKKKENKNDKKEQ